MSRIYVTPMPVNNPGGSGAGSGAGGSGQQAAGAAAAAGPGGQSRATFRPPWVKQGPPAIPMPSAPWTPNRRPSNTSADAAPDVKQPAPVRKQSKITIVPSHPTNQQAQPAQPAPWENGQSGADCDGGGGGGGGHLPSGSAFARLAALVRKVEDMERRHDEQTEEVLRKPSLANLTAIEDGPPAWELGEEPDWWRDMQQTALGARTGTGVAHRTDSPAASRLSDAGADVDEEVDVTSPDEAGGERRRSWGDEAEADGGGGDDLLEVQRQQWDDNNDDEDYDDDGSDDGGEAVEYGSEQDSHEEEEEGNNVEPAGPRRPMARTDTAEKKAPAPAADTRRPADNGRVIEEPRKRPTLTHQKSSNAPRPQEPLSPVSAPNAPPPPPAPPAPPPAPPMAPPPPPVLIDKKPLTGAQQQKLELLRNRARKRPDYSCLMKEIECGAKLKRVQCNDRSRPLLPKTKAKDQFIYESEKSNMHNQLLKQIEGGVRLKRVKCNDRSRPVLDGLRKFRRQMTVEEQMQKTETAPELSEEPDDLDDIDRVRDDLQSTKQMLALELRNKEAMERENKRLLARLLNLEAELEAERSRKSAPAAGEAVEAPLGSAPGSDKLVAKLKEENEAQQQVAKEMEARYHQAAEELDSTKAQLQEALFQKKQAEKQLKEIEDGLVEGGRALQKQLSKKLISSRSGDIRKQMSQARLNEMRKQSIPVAEADREDSESEYTDETVTDSEEEEEEDLSNDPEAQERRVQRELKLLATKLKAFKDKEASARRERIALREQLKLQQKALREERAKYKSLQKEVDKMAKLLKEDDDEGEDEDEEEEDDEEEEESEESETEEEEDAEGSGDELPADAPVDDKRNNLNNRTRRHEGILGALKKGNYLLKANIDRVKDDLSKHREMSLMLQEDLNSVLAELG